MRPRSSLTTWQVPILAGGALLEVTIGLGQLAMQALRRAQSPVPAAIRVRALLDSGAEVSCIDSQAILPLVRAGLVPKRFVFANLPAFGGLTVGTEYDVTLTIIDPSLTPQPSFVLHNHPILEQPQDRLGYQALIGRDILDLCLHIYDGPGKRLTLAY